jgi:hypothetical protein
VTVDPAWARLEARLDAADARRGRAKTGGFAWAMPAWLGWGLAGQAALLTLFAVLAGPVLAPKPEFHALGARAASPAGNMVVIFRPDTREATLRADLKAANARIVDGPTEADAYVLAAPAASRDKAVATFRARPEVMLAEPIGEGGAP